MSTRTNAMLRVVRVVNRFARLLVVVTLLTGNAWPAGCMRQGGPLGSQAPDVRATDPGRVPAILIAMTAIKNQLGTATRSHHSQFGLPPHALVLPALDRLRDDRGVRPASRRFSASASLGIRGPPPPHLTTSL